VGISHLFKMMFPSENEFIMQHRKARTCGVQRTRKNWGKRMRSVIGTILILVVGSANAASMAAVNLDSFIQHGTITNSSASSAVITSVVYDLGFAEDDIATWDSKIAGGSPSNFLSDNNFFQTVTWGGLNVAAGSSWSWNGNLDIDWISSISPLNVVGIPADSVGTSLRNASITLFWSDGSSGTTALVQQGWVNDQNLSVSSIPVPAAVLLFGSALAGLGWMRRKQAV
jgi:hypothetical protein